ncbi:MAG TPA: hypothetical protein VMU39_08085 [Solirubrobacteraceae bacterium]|nr:hypothetical protein [Solirubrobacteraceae bacterium]
MAEAKHEGGDPELHALFEQFDARLVSPGGAAQLLGVSRKTIYTLGKREELRVFRSSRTDKLSDSGTAWAFIPLVDVAKYAEKVGRPFPKGWMGTSDDRPT